MVRAALRAAHGVLLGLWTWRAINNEREAGVILEVVVGDEESNSDYSSVGVIELGAEIT